MAKWQAAAMIAALAGVAWASGGWDEAKSKADDAKRKGEEATKQFVQAEKKVVGAMCNARDLESLKDTGRSAASDARSNLRDKLTDFNHATDEAVNLLDHIDSKDSHRSDASSLESELKRAKEKIDDN